MKERRVAILDASVPIQGRPIHGVGTGSTLGAAGSIKSTKLAMNSKGGAKDKAQPLANGQTIGILQPIPSFIEIVRSAVLDIIKNGDASGNMGASIGSARSAAAVSSDTGANVAIGADAHFGAGKRQRRIVQIETGLICDVDVVDLYIPRIHAGVLRKLNSPTSAAG